MSEGLVPGLTITISKESYVRIMNIIQKFKIFQVQNIHKSRIPSNSTKPCINYLYSAKGFQYQFYEASWGWTLIRSIGLTNEISKLTSFTPSYIKISKNWNSPFFFKLLFIPFNSSITLVILIFQITLKFLSPIGLLNTLQSFVLLSLRSLLK